MKQKKIRCECDLEAYGNRPASEYNEEEQIGRIHKPNECKCTAGLRKYIRNGKIIYLCSCCVLFTDKEMV